MAVVLTVALEGDEEELVCDAVAIERDAGTFEIDPPLKLDR